MINGFHHLPYEERLSRLHLTTLERRRERGDIIEAFKILKDMDRVDKEHFFAPAQDLHETRGHTMRLRKQHCRLDARKAFFSQRVINPFNAIPPCAANSENVLELKKAINHMY